MRLLWLQCETSRTVRGWHGESAAILARASVEVMFLGLYCLKVLEAVTQLQAAISERSVTGAMHTARSDRQRPRLTATMTATAVTNGYQ